MIEQAVEDLRQDPVEGKGLPQGLRYLHQCFQLGLERGVRRSGRLTGRCVKLRHRNQLEFLLFIVDHEKLHLRFDQGVLRARPAGLPVTEREHRVADPDPVPVGDLAETLDLLVVQESAVAAVQVFHEVVVLDEHDPGVVAAGGPRIDRDVAVGMPPQDALGHLELPGLA